MVRRSRTAPDEQDEDENHLENLLHRQDGHSADELSSDAPSELFDSDEDTSDGDEADREAQSAPRATEERIFVPGNAMDHSADLPPAAENPVLLSDAVAALRNLSNFNDLKKKLERVEASDKLADVPLPRVASQRLEREQGYDKVAAGVSKWQPLVKKNRETDGVRRFPVNATPRQVPTLAGAGTRQRVVMTGMEQEIEELLQKSGLANEREAAEAEKLAMNELTEKEVLERRRELAKMKSLLFFEEKKAKRVKKIKSKKYRRIQKKDKERKRALAPGADNDPIEKALQRERERVEERMTLKHKNTSKWVKRKLARQEAKHNESTRAAIEDQLRVGEKLRQKIRTNDSEDDEDSVEAAETTEPSPSAGGSAGEVHSGLMGLKFMQRAMEKKRARQQAVRREDVDEEDEGEEDPPKGLTRLRFQGRPKSGTEGADIGDDGDDGSQSDALVSKEEDADDGMTSLPRGTTSGFQAKTDTIITVTSREKKGRIDAGQPNGHRALKSKTPDNPWLKKVSNGSRELQADGGAPRPVAMNPTKTATATVGNAKTKSKREESRALLQEAFQGAGAEEDDFAGMKEAEVDATLPSAEDLGLSEIPGWGSWSGAGVKQTRGQKRRAAGLKEEMAASKEAAKRKRRDFDQSHVILSEKRIKRAAELTVEKAPFPFASMKQYEASLSAPLGKDWTTPSIYRRNVRPKVVIKTGVVIDPIRFGGDKGRVEAAARSALA